MNGSPLISKIKMTDEPGDPFLAIPSRKMSRYTMNNFTGSFQTGKFPKKKKIDFGKSMGGREFIKKMSPLISAQKIRSIHGNFVNLDSNGPGSTSMDVLKSGGIDYSTEVYESPTSKMEKKEPMPLQAMKRKKKDFKNSLLTDFSSSPIPSKIESNGNDENRILKDTIKILKEKLKNEKKQKTKALRKLKEVNEKYELALKLKEENEILKEEIESLKLKISVGLSKNNITNSSGFEENLEVKNEPQMSFSEGDEIAVLKDKIAWYEKMNKKRKLFFEKKMKEMAMKVARDYENMLNQVKNKARQLKKNNLLFAKENTEIIKQLKETQDLLNKAIVIIRYIKRNHGDVLMDIGVGFEVGEILSEEN